MSLYHGWKRVAAVAAFFVALWLCLRYLYPIFLPFLLGLAAALSAERPVRILQQRLHFAPGISVFAAVTLIWVGLTAALGLSAVLQARPPQASPPSGTGHSGWRSRRPMPCPSR